MQEIEILKVNCFKKINLKIENILQKPYKFSGWDILGVSFVLEFLIWMENLAMADFGVGEEIGITIVGVFKAWGENTRFILCFLLIFLFHFERALNFEILF